MNIIPAKNFVILTIPQQETKSGLVAPTTTKDTPQVGTVYKIGAGTKPVPFKVGDTLIFKKYMGDRKFIPQIGEELEFIPFDDIVAVLSE